MGAFSPEANNPQDLNEADVIEKAKEVEAMLSRPPRVFVTGKSLDTLYKNGETLIGEVNFYGRQVQAGDIIYLVTEGMREIPVKFVEVVTTYRSDSDPEGMGIKVKLPEMGEKIGV